MNTATALYRKYRPSSFAEVRNQDHIVTVLEGAISKKTLPHALLFSGGRGTGKTTVARIFAAAVGAQPIDIYEIDAASNRGIDDIRELKEAVHTTPYESPYKVYIIDEVHMLTKEAFNALLKTLEEPPAHVIFILATTEEEKLLDTIISRCQVFRFRNPSRTDLADAIISVAKKEGFEIAIDAADLIAAAANGSFRDALGVTQKVILASKDAIGGADEVAQIIGAPKQSILVGLLSSFHSKDIETGLQAVAEAKINYVEPTQLIRMMLDIVRVVMIVRYQPQREEIVLRAYASEIRSIIKSYALSSSSNINSLLLKRLLQVAFEISRSPLPFLPLEIAIMEMGESQKNA
jgi:DNA polymerase III subunit gamma/tau